LTQPTSYPAGIHWVTRSADSLLADVRVFLEAASAKGIRVSIVECPTFDELAADIADGSSWPQQIDAHIGAYTAPSKLKPVSLPTVEHSTFPVLRCSALPILEMPRVARRIKLDRSVTTPEARQMLRDADVWAIVASRGNEIAAFGNDEGLVRAFAGVGGRLDGTMTLAPNIDSWALGLLYEAITRAVCRHRPLRARRRRGNHAVMVHGDSEKETDQFREVRLSKQAKLRNAYSSALYGTTPQGYPFYEGVELHLEQAAERWWLTFEPTTFVEVPYPEHAQEKPNAEATLERPRFVDPTIDWRRERWANR